MFKTALFIAAMVTLSPSAFAGDCSPGSLIYDDAFYKLCDREREGARAAAGPQSGAAEGSAAPVDARKHETPAVTEGLRDVRDSRAGARL